MWGSTTHRWDTLERWSPTLFLVAGALLVVHVAIHALIAFTNVTYPLHHEFPFGFVGMVLGFVGLFGLYPRMVDRSPRLARAGAVLAVLGTAGWFVIGGQALAEALGVAPPEGAAVVVAPLVILGTILTYLTFGAASLRTDAVSRTTALVVATPALVMVYNLGSAALLSDLTAGPVIVAAGFALAHLAIGVALHNEEFPAGGRAAETDMAV
jgi:hypothetical protein